MLSAEQVRVLPAHRLRTFREWFLQLPEEQPPPGAHARGPRDHAPWLGPTETFRETNDLSYYVPPLTRTLLAALGVGGASLHAGSACTEAAMYSFVIEWTPALTTSLTHPPCGLVFSAFMVAYMSGSTLVTWLASIAATPSAVLPSICAVAALAMGVVATLAFAYSGATAVAPLQATYGIFLAMCLFEMCLGAYFALVGAVKAQQVPERLRAAVYGSFRVPLNLLVVVLELASPDSSTVFFVCTLLLLSAVGCFYAAHRGVVAKRAREGSASTEASPLVGK